MTVPFLKKVVEDLTAKLHDLSNVVIVVPGKRAGLFFNQYLEQVCQLPVWTPAFKTLDEIFDQLTELSVPDTPLLIYHLYEAYQQTVALQAGETPVVSEPLDHFYAWGEVMLSDFDDIDNNLSHADDIFRNLQDLDELTDMDYLSEDQLKAIERYFGYFDKDKDSRLKEKFLSVWNLLCPTYHRFRERLLKRKLAYPGMLKRMVVEKGVDTELLKAEKYVFVGFNVLNATERTLLDRLKQEQKAMFYWDYDRAYMKDGNLASAYAEAGRFVMDNVGHFGSELNAEDICYDNMHNSKKITFVASPSDNAQARFAGEWLHENVSADSQLNQTAVVLCDEKLLQPMLHSLPTDSNGRDYQMNVTMGFPLIETPASSFVLALMQLQTFGGRGNWWNYTQVANVLKHPYAVRMAGEKAVGKLADIKKNNMFFIDPAFFDDDEDLEAEVELSPLKRDKDEVPMMMPQEQKVEKQESQQLHLVDHDVELPPEPVLQEETEEEEPTLKAEEEKPQVVDMYDEPIDFRVVEDLPQFPGGAAEFMKWLTKNLKYPASAQQRKIKGKVVAQFIVNKDGTLSDLQVVQPLEPACDQEVLRVLKMMPQWKAGMMNAKPCRTMVCIPVVFNL